MPHDEVTVSRHLLRRRAEAKATDLNHDLSVAEDHGVADAWISTRDLPAWTIHFQVRRARKRSHYRVVAVDGPV